MTVFFSETFATAGSPIGNQPTVCTPAPISGVAWADDSNTGSIQFSGGEAVGTSVSGGSTAGIKVEATPTVGGVINPTGSILHRTKAVQNGSGYSLTVEFTIGGKYIMFAIQWVSAGNWDVVAFNNNDLVTSAVALDPDTEYAVTFSIEDGAQSVTVNGVTSSLTTAFVSPEYGVSTVALHLGPTSTASAFELANVPYAIFNLTAPSATVEAISSAHATLVASAPSSYIQANSGGNAQSLTQPKATVFGTGHDSTGENGFALFGPIATASGHFGGKARLTASTGTLGITGTFVVLGTAALVAPAPTVNATGRVSSNGSAAVESPSASLIGYGGAVVSITLTGKPTLQATGKTGSVGRFRITAPLCELSASGTTGSVGSANLVAPSPELGNTGRILAIAPGATLVAIGHAVVAVTYEAYALNIKHSGDKTNEEMTRYTNYPFTQIVRYKGSYYGMNATGLFLLEGTTDDGDDIAWEFETHVTDFGSPKLKTVERAYFGGRLGPDATVTLSVGETADNSYSYTTPRGQTAQNYRQVFGKGAKARYFSIGASGTDAIELDSLELAVTELTRRI